jgi:hypothetical protein
MPVIQPPFPKSRSFIFIDTARNCQQIVGIIVGGHCPAIEERRRQLKECTDHRCKNGSKILCVIGRNELPQLSPEPFVLSASAALLGAPGSQQPECLIDVAECIARLELALRHRRPGFPAIR